MVSSPPPIFGHLVLYPGKPYKRVMKYCVLLLLAAQAAFAGDALPDFLPPGTKMMFGIQVRQITGSSLAKGVMPDSKAMGADWQKVVTLAGFDPLKDVEEVLIASTGKGENPPVLLVARGTFNAGRFSANAKPYHGVPVME